MSDSFSQSILLKVVAQICQMVGFHNIMTTPLDLLTDLLRSSIIKLGQTAQHYAEHCGRSCINLNDLSLAFSESGIRPSELLKFLRTVKPLPQGIVVSRYPIAKGEVGTLREVGVLCDETQSFRANQLNYDNERRETLKIKISLSKIKAATESKRNKSSRNKKKKKKKHSRSKS